LTISYEDVFFYLDLTKDALKKKDVIKAIHDYIAEKNKVNVKGHYGVLIFQEEGNPVFITDKKDSDIIAKAIEENWKSRPKSESFFENGLFYIFSFIAESVRKKSKYNRVIIITDTPSDLNESYQEALFNLVDKIKHFPTFIDIIRVTDKSTRFFKDDVKLNILASDTKGGIFQVQDRNEFLSIVNKLTKQKQLVTTFADRHDQIKISSDDYAFYSRLAKPLKRQETTDLSNCYFCHEAVCPVCTDINDIPLICEECNSPFHNCCVTNFTISHNIGIPHIFRCPSCDILLKIDEDEIVEVSGEEGVTSVKEYVEAEVFEDFDSPKIIEDDDITLPESEITLPPPTAPKYIPPIPLERGEAVKKIRIGGFFGKVFSVRKSGDKLIYERITKTIPKYEAEVFIEDSVASQEINQNNEESNIKRRKINFCPICGASLKSTQTKCPSCGYILS
jgi:hypothetical protein